MQRTISISADDFGLTQGITDTILETVDQGPVRLVSILANGEAVEYALSEYKKRSPFLKLALHLNLTEGKALSMPNDIPHLVDAKGMFRYSIARLWLAYIFGSRMKRSALRTEVHREIMAQCAVIRDTLGTKEFVINGHQHVHLIPFVFGAVMDTAGVSTVRIVREPFYICGMPSVRNTLARFVLALLSRHAAKRARMHGIHTNDWFIGLLYSGRMNEHIARVGLSKTGNGSVEMLFHPGSARDGELQGWQRSRADVAWHYSVQRTREREALKRLHINGPPA